MVEIHELIVRAKINSEFDPTEQELVKVINEQIHDFLSKHDALSKIEKRNLIDDCIREVFDKIEEKTPGE